MAYAKFITKADKEGRPVRYGPYYYKSIRTPEGKVRNIYLGTELAKENGKARRIKGMLARIAAG
jgi:hypothetical protein